MATKKAAPKRVAATRQRAGAAQHPAKVAKKAASVKAAAKAAAKTTIRTAAAAAAPPKKERKKNVVADSIDLRDRPYMPSVTVVPAARIPPPLYIPVLNQHETNACTGFALASVIYHLQYKANERKQIQQNVQAVSPFMLYSMARRYDEFPGSPRLDTGSSLRGAMKGWYKYGACPADLWKHPTMPKPNPDPAKDWWQNAVTCPLGAYYRVDTKAVTDMQIALNEIGALYASAVCHTGWLEGENVQATGDDPWTIPYQDGATPVGAHAFAIVGYTQNGFIIHNSWDTNWGSGGRATLTYEDWTSNAMDCWVAQLGVRTELERKIAAAPSLRWAKNRVQLASDPTLRNRELDPFIIDMENNGRLSNTGDFRTQDSDVDALLNQHMGEARKVWQLGDNDPMDIAIYAHGGLTSEEDAANTAECWVKALYDSKIFPIFLMWETDLFSTLKDIAADQKVPMDRTTGTMWDKIKNFWNQRVEKLLTVPGSKVWGEMKKNADAISGNTQSGGMKLYASSLKSPYFKDKSKVRLHLIGHSAGSIVHSYIIDRLKDWTFETVNFMAPAVTTQIFKDMVQPAIEQGRVKQYNQFELLDNVEQKDPTCEKLLGYSRSLLYLVSNSFEQGKVTPILGMQKYFDQEVAPLKLKNVSVYTSPGQFSQSMTHGGFDDDEATRKKIISLI
jgi:hypothetical protein